MHRRAVIGSHDCRHTAATLLGVQGGHPKAIQAVLGWDEVAMVDRYTRFVDEMRRDAPAKMDVILEPGGCQLGCQTGTKKAK
jgi:integrase